MQVNLYTSLNSLIWQADDPSDESTSQPVDHFQHQAQILSFRTAEVLFDSTAREFRKLKLLIEETLPLVNLENFPEELLDAAVELKTLKAEFYKMRNQHEQSIQFSNIVFRRLRRALLEAELKVLAVQEKTLNSSSTRDTNE